MVAGSGTGEAGLFDLCVNHTIRVGHFPPDNDVIALSIEIANDVITLSIETANDVIALSIETANNRVEVVSECPCPRSAIIYLSRKPCK